MEIKMMSWCIAIDVVGVRMCNVIGRAMGREISTDEV